MTLQLLGAVAGVLGAIALVVSAVSNRRQGGETLAHSELADALIAQRGRIDDLTIRLDKSEQAEQKCREDMASMREEIDMLKERDQ